VGESYLLDKYENFSTGIEDASNNFLGASLFGNTGFFNLRQVVVANTLRTNYQVDKK